MTKLILSLALPALTMFATEDLTTLDCAPMPCQPLLDCAPAEDLPTQKCTPMHECAPTDLLGRYQVEDAYGFTILGSALYWKAYEEGLDYVIKNTGATAINNDGNVERPSFDWDWGCRVDLGYQIPQKKMDLNLCWTWYRTDGTVSKQVASPTTLFSVWSVPNGMGNAYEFQSKAHTNLTLNRIDLGMSAAFSPRKFLDITPRVDLSALWIHQNFQFNLSGGPGLGGLFITNDDIDMKNHFFGIGPKMGIGTLWDLGYGLGIVGNFNLSLIYGFFNISQKEIVTLNGGAPNTSLDLETNFYHNPRMNFDLLLGMRWDRMFCCDKYHLLLEAGWENLIFLGQNQLMRFVNQTYPGINNLVKGDLSFQGLSLRGAFTF